MRFLSRLLTQLVLRLLLTVALGALVLALQGRLPLPAAMTGGAEATTPPGTIDPQAEADRVARTLADLAARLRGGGTYAAAPTPASEGPAGVATAPAPGDSATGLAAPDRGSPRVLNGGGAGHFHRAPQDTP